MLNLWGGTEEIPFLCFERPGPYKAAGFVGHVLVRSWPSVVQEDVRAQEQVGRNCTMGRCYDFSVGYALLLISGRVLRGGVAGIFGSIAVVEMDEI